MSHNLIKRALEHRILSLLCRRTTLISFNARRLRLQFHEGAVAKDSTELMCGDSLYRCISPILLSQLWKEKWRWETTVSLQSGFRCSQSKMTSKATPSTAASVEHNKIQRKLDGSLIDLLVERRGQNGKKIHETRSTAGCS